MRGLRTMIINLKYPTYFEALFKSLSLTIFICFYNYHIAPKSFIPGSWFPFSFFDSLKDQSLTLLLFMSFVLCIFINYESEKLSVRPEKKWKVIFSLFAIAFSISFILGKSFQFLSNWSLLFSTQVNLFTCIVIAVFASIAVYELLIGLYLLINWISKRDTRVDYDKNYFYYSLISFGLVELIYMIIFCPGTAHFDGIRQLTVYYGFVPLSDHHPAVATFLMGSVVELGRNIAGYSFGLFLWNCLQAIFQILVFSYAVDVTAKLTKSKLCTLFVFLFLLINPVFAIWGIYFVKDTVFYIDSLWFILNLIVLYEHNILRIKHYYILGLQIAASTIILCLFRHNGFFVVIPTFIFSLLYFRKDIPARKILILNTCLICLIGACYSPALNYFHVVEAPKAEKLFIPFQQTARLFRDGKEIEAQDKIIIQKCFNNKNIGKLYKPEFSDPVKNAFQDEDNNITDFKRFYFKYMTRYPGTYLQALINQNYGYFYPEKKSKLAGEYNIENKKTLYPDIIKLHYLSPLGKIRALFTFIPDICRTIPVLSLFYNCSFYTWSVLFLYTIGLLYLNPRILILGFPLLLTIAICLVSPVNAYIRYMLPVMAMLPVWAAYVYYLIKFKNNIL